MSSRLKALVGNVFVGILAILLSLVLGAIPLLLGGIDPLAAYASIVKGSLGSTYNITEMLVKATPLLLGGLAVAFAFRCGFWNIGVEGQIFMGMVFAVWAGFSLAGVSPIIHVPVVVLAGFLGGAFWGIIPAILKVRLRVNEVLTTLMMNYVAFWIMYYLNEWPWRNPEEFNPQTYPIAHSAELPILIAGTRLHAGIVVAAICALLVFMILERSSLGYRIRAVGANPEAARYAGIDVTWTVITTMIISGGLAGLSGMGEVAGLHHYLEWDLTTNYGYISIAVAMIGSLNAFGTIFAALLIGTLTNGSSYMQRSVGASAVSVYIVIGLVILFILLVPVMKSVLTKSRSPLTRVLRGK